MLPTRLVRALLTTLACLTLLVPTAFAADPVRIPDGHDWVFYSAEYKVWYLEQIFSLVRERGVIAKYHPLFYYVQLNVYYSDWDSLDVDLGNALSDIGEWAGDLAMAKE